MKVVKLFFVSAFFLLMAVSCFMDPIDPEGWFDQKTKAEIDVFFEVGDEAYLGKSITLDGSSSICGSGETLTYKWELVSKPDASGVILLSELTGERDLTASSIIFSPDKPGVYTIDLTVEDDDEDIDTTSKIIVAKDKPQSYPSNIIASDIKTNEVKLSWDIVENAVMYTVFRDTVQSGSYSHEVWTGSGLTCTDNTLEPGKQYFYKVSASNPVGSSMMSPEISVITPLETPLNFNRTSNTLTTANLDWDESANAEEYIVEYSKFEDEGFVEGYRNETHECTIEGLESGEIYFFRVKAVNDISDSDTDADADADTDSEWSETVRVNLSVTPPPIPENIRITSGTESSLTLAWDNILEADSYNIYRANEPDAGYSLVEEHCAENTFTDDALSSGTRYYYKVSAVKRVIDEGEETVIEGGHSSSFDGITVPAPPADFEVSEINKTSIRLHWTKAAGANNYKIYKSSHAAGIFREVDPSFSKTGTDYTVTGLTGGTTYFFKIKAHNSRGDSSFSETVSATTSYNIIASAGSGGSINPNGDVTVDPGQNKTFSITADEGYEISQVIVDGVNRGRIPRYTFYSVDSDHTISAKFEADIWTITATAGSNGRISPSGSVSVLHGAGKSFTITPYSGYKVSQVIVDGVNKGALSRYSFSNVTANHSIRAEFERIFTIAASDGDGGDIDPEGDVSVDYGGAETFHITPDTGHRISRVIVDGVNKGALSSYSFRNVTANHSIRAEFERKSLTIEASDGSGGDIDPEGDVSVDYGGSKTFYITPNSGYRISRIIVDGTDLGAKSTYEFRNVTSSGHSIRAEFEREPLTIKASDGSGGDIDPEGDVSVDYGGSKTFSIDPYSGYKIDRVIVDGTDVGAKSTYEFRNVTSNHTIEARFSKISTDIQAKSVSMTVKSTWVRDSNPLLLQYSFKNNGPTSLSNNNYKIDVYLSKNSIISTSDTKIGDNIISLNLRTGQTGNYSATNTGLSYFKIPRDCTEGTYYVGLHIIPLDGTPTDSNDSNNWIVGNTLQIPLRFKLVNNSSKTVKKLNIRQPYTSSWGDDLLSTDLSPDMSTYLFINLDDSEDWYDVRAEGGWLNTSSWQHDNMKIGGSEQFTWTLID